MKHKLIMKRIAFLLLVLGIISCSKDNLDDQTAGIKLVTIEYEDDYSEWSVNYFYSSDGDLIMIEDLFSLGRRTEIEYEGSRVKEYLTYSMDDEKLIFRDSVAYNADGTIKAKYNFLINRGEDLPLAYIYEYEYNSDGKLDKHSTFMVHRQEYLRVNKYHWKKGNVIKVEEFDEKGKLKHVVHYKYDNKSNYRNKLSPALNTSPYVSKNNITKMEVDDYTGTIDLVCNPCKSKYKYNKENYPISIKSDGGLVTKLYYE